jgi:hypothetical protein
MRPHQRNGLPIGIEITPGQVHDITAYPALMGDIGCAPEQMLGDKGYGTRPFAGISSGAVARR